jgi:hypothetical protein
VDFGVPILTDINVAIALTDALNKLQKGEITLEAEKLKDLIAKEDAFKLQK